MMQVPIWTRQNGSKDGCKEYGRKLYEAKNALRLPGGPGQMEGLKAGEMPYKYKM
jgi:hypothetical protein